MIPLIRARPGIRIPELAHIFGVRESEIWEDITEILSLCGVPPYLPHNYLVFGIHGDRVTIRFAEHLGMAGEGDPQCRQRRLVLGRSPAAARLRSP